MNNLNQSSAPQEGNHPPRFKWTSLLWLVLTILLLIWLLPSLLGQSGLQTHASVTYSTCAPAAAACGYRCAIIQ